MTRSRWVRWILAPVGIVVAVLAIAILILFTMDLGRFEPEVEAYLTEFTGRDVVIDGEFHASLGQTVEIRVGDAKLGNAAWSSTSNMLEIGAIELRFSFWSMFGKTLEIEYLKIAGVEVFVEARDGDVNWSFDPDAEVSEWLASQSVTQYTTEFAEITDVTLHYGEGWLDDAQTVELSRCVLEETSDKFVSINLEGRLDDYAVTVTGFAGPQDSLARGEAVDLDLAMDVGDFRLVTRGHVERVEPLEHPEISFEFTGPDVSDLLAKLGLPVFTSGPVDLRGNYDEQPPGAKLDVTGSVGEVQLDVHGALQDREHLEGLQLNFLASGPRLQELVNIVSIDYLPVGAFSLRGQLDGASPPFKLHDVVVSIGDISAELDGAIGTDQAAVTATASGPDFAAFLATWTDQPVPAGPFEIGGGLQHVYGSDEWVIDETTVSLQQTGVSARFDGRVGLNELTLQVSGSGPDFVGFLRTWTERSLPQGPFVANGGVKRQFDDNVWHASDVSVEFETGLELQLDGDIEPTPEFLRVHADIAAAAPELADVLAIWFEEPPLSGPFQARARLGKEQYATRYDEIEVTLRRGPQSPADHVAGSLVFEPDDVPRIRAELYSDGFDLTRYLDALYDRRIDAQEEESEFWFPDIPVSLNPLDLIDLDVAVNAKTLALDDDEVMDLEMRLAVKDGNLVIDPLSATYLGGSVSGRLRADDSEASPLVSADLQFREVMLDDPLDDEGNAIERPVLTANIEFMANGNSTREMLASANGTIRVDESAGFMEFDPLKAVLDAIYPPLMEEKYIKLDCFVLHSDISDGVATARAVAIQTERLKIAARGDINLGTEALDLQFKVVPRTDIGVSAVSIASPHVAVTGTIQNPGIAFGTGATVAAVITDGWTMVFDAFNDIASRGTNVCEEALQRAGVP